ncbi:MAG: hypothetical protein AAGU74_05190 [Bacillota bacterium]
MKNNRLRKTLALALCAALLLTLLPATALAAAAPGGTLNSLDEAAVNAVLGAGNWAAATTATANDTVKLTADITLTNTLTVNTDMILDLNGRTLSGAAGALGNMGITALSVSAGRVLTLLDSHGGGSVTGGVGGGGSGGSGVTVSGTLNLLGGSVTGGGGVGGSLGGSGVTVSGTLNMLGGSVTGGGGGSGGGSGVMVTGTLNALGGSITGGSSASGHGIVLNSSNAANIGPNAVVAGSLGGHGVLVLNGNVHNSGIISGSGSAQGVLLNSPAFSLYNDGTINGGISGGTVYGYTARPSLTATTPVVFGSADYGYAAVAAQSVSVGYDGDLIAPVQITPPASASFSLSAGAADIIGRYGYILPGSRALSYSVAPNTGLAVGNYNESLCFMGRMNTATSSTASSAVSFTVLETTSTPPDNGDSISRTLTDSATGVTVSGIIQRSASLTVKDVSLHAAGTCAACDKIRARMADDSYALLLGRDISLSGGFTGPLTITFPVGSGYNGETVTLLHCKGGVLETLTAAVRDGKAIFTVTGLSPFAVFAVSGASTDIPQTGDGGGFPMWLGLSATGALCGCLLLIRKKKRA